jgi:hypothetical protein
MKATALAIAFLLELVAFVFFAGVSFTLHFGISVQIVVAVLLFVLLIAFWSIYMAPKAPRKVGIVAYYIYKSCIYAVSAYSLYAFVGLTALIVFVIAVALDEIILFRHNLQSS